MLRLAHVSGQILFLHYRIEVGIFACDQDGDDDLRNMPCRHIRFTSASPHPKQQLEDGRDSPSKGLHIETVVHAGSKILAP